MQNLQKGVKCEPEISTCENAGRSSARYSLCIQGKALDKQNDFTNRQIHRFTSISVHFKHIREESLDLYQLAG